MAVQHELSESLITEVEEAQPLQAPLEMEVEDAAERLALGEVPSPEEFRRIRKLADHMHSLGRGSHMDAEAANRVTDAANPESWVLSVGEAFALRDLAHVRRLADIPPAVRDGSGIPRFAQGQALVDKTRNEARARLTLNETAHEVIQQEEDAAVASERQHAYDRTLRSEEARVEVKVDAAIRDRAARGKLGPSQEATMRAGLKEQFLTDARAKAEQAAEDRKTYIKENGGIKAVLKDEFMERVGSRSEHRPDRSSAAPDIAPKESFFALEKPEDMPLAAWLKVLTENRREKAEEYAERKRAREEAQKQKERTAAALAAASAAVVPEVVLISADEAASPGGAELDLVDDPDALAQEAAERAKREQRFAEEDGSLGRGPEPAVDPAYKDLYKDGAPAGTGEDSDGDGVLRDNEGTIIDEGGLEGLLNSGSRNPDDKRERRRRLRRRVGLALGAAAVGAAVITEAVLTSRGGNVGFGHYISSLPVSGNASFKQHLHHVLRAPGYTGKHKSGNAPQNHIPGYQHDRVPPYQYDRIPGYVQAPRHAAPTPKPVTGSIEETLGPKNPDPSYAALHALQEQGQAHPSEAEIMGYDDAAGRQLFRRLGERFSIPAWYEQARHLAIGLKLYFPRIRR